MESCRDELRKIFGIRWKQTLAHNTLRNILHSISESELENSFRQHANALKINKRQLTVGKQIQQIAFDGKHFVEAWIQALINDLFNY